MTDEELLELLRKGPEHIYRYVDADHAAADRIEALEQALRDIAGVAKLGMGHNLAPVVRMAQRIEAMAVSAHLREEK